MNKFLAEQLLEFNQQMGDQFRENWGSILNFVHEDPDQWDKDDEAKNNSSIDIFKNAMRLKESKLMDEKNRKELILNQSSVSALAQKFSNDEKERVQAMIDEALEAAAHVPVTSLGESDNDELSVSQHQ